MSGRNATEAPLGPKHVLAAIGPDGGIWLADMHIDTHSGVECGLDQVLQQMPVPISSAYPTDGHVKHPSHRLGLAHGQAFNRLENSRYQLGFDVLDHLGGRLGGFHSSGSNLTLGARV